MESVLYRHKKNSGLLAAAGCPVSIRSVDDTGLELAAWPVAYATGKPPDPPAMRAQRACGTGHKFEFSNLSQIEALTLWGERFYLVDDTKLELQNSFTIAYQGIQKCPILNVFLGFRIPFLTKEKQLLQSS